MRRGECRFGYLRWFVKFAEFIELSNFSEKKLYQFTYATTDKYESKIMRIYDGIRKKFLL